MKSREDKLIAKINNHQKKVSSQIIKLEEILEGLEMDKILLSSFRYK